MCTIEGRQQTVLLVIDVQVDVVSNAFDRDHVVGRIAGLVDQARAAGTQVVWVQHSDEELVRDSAAWQIVPELVPAAGEPRVYKTFRSSFIETDLEDVLQGLNAARLVICGAETNNCVRHTSHSALERGYDVVLVADAHTTNSYEWRGHKIDAAMVIDEQNDNFGGLGLPGRSASVAAAADIKF